jgi:hypothetical protein
MMAIRLGPHSVFGQLVKMHMTVGLVIVGTQGTIAVWKDTLSAVSGSLQLFWHYCSYCVVQEAGKLQERVVLQAA